MGGVQRLFARGDNPSMYRLLSEQDELLGQPRGPLLVVAAMSILGGLTQAATLLVIVRAAAALTVETQEISGSVGPFAVSGLTSGQLIAIAFGLVGLFFVVDMAGAYAVARVTARTQRNVRMRLLRLHADADWPTKEKLEGTALVQLLTANTNQAVTFVAQTAATIAAAATFGTMAVSALVINPAAALVMCAGVGAILIASMPLTRVIRGQARYATALNQEFAALGQERAALGRELHVFQVNEASLPGIQAAADKAARLRFRSTVVARLGASFFRVSALALILSMLAFVNAVGPADMASLAAVALILLRSVTYGQALQSNYQGMASQAGWVENLADEAEALAEGAATASSTRPVSVGSAPVGLRFDDVSFAYGDGAPVLRHVTLEIEPGSSVGIVGRSGAGKSTLAQLMLGLRSPSSGSIEALGADTRDWVHRLAFVPQEPVLLDLTVADNVRFHRSWLSDESVTDALRAAHMLDDVLGWPRRARHPSRRPRQPPLGWPAPAHRARPRPRRRPGPPRARRADLGSRRGLRGGDQRHPRRAARRDDRRDHRPPTVDARSLRPDRRLGRGRGDRQRGPTRARRAQRLSPRSAGEQRPRRGLIDAVTGWPAGPAVTVGPMRRAVRHNRSAAFDEALRQPRVDADRWHDTTDDPNDARALAFRARTLRSAARPPTPNRVAFLRDRCRDRRILDIGCVAHTIDRMNSPLWLHGQLAEVASSCVGVDVNGLGIRAMQDRGFDAIEHDLQLGPGPLAERAPFDVIVAGEVFEHVVDLGMLFRTATDLLRPGGSLIITTPNPYSPRRIWAGQRGIVFENVDHIAYAFPSGIAEIAERHGMRLTEMTDVQPGSASLFRRFVRNPRSTALQTIRSLTGASWRDAGFTSTAGQMNHVLVREDRRLGRSERRFTGETFIYVVSRA